ncbi:MAG: hypothetical protein CMA50_03445 [Euryarchaeota archaeon]|jgi:small subunit ribosomal protein S24e|nr:hypothetical protein [Euryarchaeota archaeon]|tara:strand:- start:9459 stop:9791 length:333 start_codon:yes stop_codon:yes gene_type:complete
MEIIERKENPLLNRVEITFRWEHSKAATPTLSEMVAAAAKAEPGSKKELTFVKEVNTRFGRSQTTGIALIYGNSEAATLEPEYVHNRHEAIHSPKAKEDSTEQTEEGGDE